MNSPTCALHPDQYAGATCPRCGNFTCATCNPDGRTMCPTCRTLTNDATGNKTPWERRAELGLVKAFIDQVKETMFEPRRFWATVDRNGSAADAFWFGWLVTVIATIGSTPYQVFNFWSQGKQFEDLSRQMGDVPAMKMFLQLFSWFGEHPLMAAALLCAWGVVMYPITFFIHVGLVHVGCVLAGMRNHPINVTVRALAYASAPNLGLVIPVVGGFASFYTLVLQVWGLRELQQGTTGRAIVATLWFSILICCAGMVAGVAAVMMLANRIG